MKSVSLYLVRLLERSKVIGAVAQLLGAPDCPSPGRAHQPIYDRFHCTGRTGEALEQANGVLALVHVLSIPG